MAYRWGNLTESAVSSKSDGPHLHCDADNMRPTGHSLSPGRNLRVESLAKVRGVIETMRHSRIDTVLSILKSNVRQSCEPKRRRGVEIHLACAMEDRPRYSALMTRDRLYRRRWPDSHGGRCGSC